MSLFKKWTSKAKHEGEILWRSKYEAPSRRFLEWVNTAGFEQTWFGKIFQYFDQRFHLRRISLLFLFCLCLSFLMFSDFEFPYSAQIGEVATVDIKSPISLTLIDEVSTDEKKNEAEKTIPPVFDYDANVYEGIFNNVYKAFRNMRKEARNVNWPTNDIKREEAEKDFFQYKPQFEKDLAQPVSDRMFQWLIEKRFSARIENIVIRSLLSWSNNKIIESPSSLIPEPSSKLLVRVVDKNSSGDEFTLQVKDVKFLKDRDTLSLAGVRGSETLPVKDQQNAVAFAQSLVVPNLTFNKQETTSRRQKVREAVLPIQISVKKNQIVVSAGSVIQPLHVNILNEIRNLKSDRRTDFIALISAALFLILSLVFFSYTRRFTTNKVKVDFRDVTVMGLVTLIVVAFTKMFLFMTDAAFISRLGPVIPPMALLLAAPIATGPMLVGLLVTYGEIVWLFTAFLSVAVSVMVDMNFGLLVVSMIGGIAAARGVYGCQKRNDLYWAGLRTGLVNALVILALVLMQKLGDADLWHYLAWCVPAGILSGFLSSMLALMIIPLLESMFNYTTDVKLLELASLNHPLMQAMIVKAPGTYHHSLIVGSMCEAAAQEIGANALLAKVMAYYHDIGKTDHAQYFIENQRPGYNPHDHISPYMSKTVLIAHVKDGAEMGIQHKLGKPIIDGILQHHGTTLISYFYNKAIEAQDEDISLVDEEDFRYPGPKPQFREAALVMLADSIEAAARSLDEPTPARLQNIVKNIIQTKFLDGQLEQCNLTLRDLSVIDQAFKRILLGVYHHRIDYPKANAEATAAQAKLTAVDKPAARGGGKRGPHSA